MLRIVRLRSTIKQFCNGYLGDKTTLLSNLIDFFKHFMIVFEKFNASISIKNVF